jgi:hypothetical protein
MAWSNQGGVPSHKFICGFCGSSVASSLGYFSDRIEGDQGWIHLCPHCDKPNFFHKGAQVPGITPGNEVGHLPQDIEALYREARKAVSVGAYTASVLACRKLLMNLAVAQGAKAGDSFLSYVDHLAGAGFVPPNGRGWVDHIRKKGNEANHEIALMAQTDAADLLAFTEMLLKFIYEFPNRVPAHTP